MCYIRIVEQSPRLIHITIWQDGTSNHYSIQLPQGNIIDPEKRDVHLRCMRVWESSEDIVARNLFNVSSLALLNDDVDDELKMDWNGC